MIYTIEQIHDILTMQGWYSFICDNQLDCNYLLGFDTIRVSEDEERDYFGEFFGNREENQYAFKLYIE